MVGWMVHVKLKYECLQFRAEQKTTENRTLLNDPILSTASQKSSLQSKLTVADPRYSKPKH